MFVSLIEMDWSMTTIYMACAAGGGSLLILQTLLLLLGWGDADVDLDADTDIDAGDGAFSIFSLRAVVSFFTFFGLTGWLGTTRGWDPMLTVFAAAASGTSLMFVVAWLMAMQTKLESKGNIDPKNAVGKTARVYLRVPARNDGVGKITVNIQSRSAEYTAFTNGDELPTGATVRITRMTTPNTFEVVALTEEKS
jgi:hypothetical protein